jgi:fibronectin type 3 domain-containing protein
MSKEPSRPFVEEFDRAPASVPAFVSDTGQIIRPEPPHFYPAQAASKMGYAAPAFSVSDSNEPLQLPDAPYTPPPYVSSGITGPAPVYSYQSSSPQFHFEEPSRTPAKTDEVKKTEEPKSSASDDTSPSNSAVGSYGGLPDASPAGNSGTTGTSHSDAGNPASPPIIISAVGAPGAVELAWQAASSSTPVTYSIERSLSSNSGFSVIAAGVNGTTYTDNTAINGTLYYYRVASLNATGGAYSEVISAVASDLPTTPTLVVSASDGVGSLSWNTSTGLGVITYSVERSLTSGSGFGVVTSGLASPNFTDSSLTDGTLYYYRVQAHNTAGDSNYSPEVTAKSIDAFILGTATAGIESTVLTWNSAVGATAYDVKYGTSTGTYTTTLTNKTSPFTITGLTANTTYYFSVKATNSDHGLTLSTNELSAKPLGAFTITSLTPTDIGKLKIIWGASSGATSYDIGCGTTTGDYTAITLTNQTSPTTITGLSNATTYYCQVTAKNATGQGNAATEASATTFSLLTYNWPFDAATDAAYSFDASKLELVGGVSRLKNLAPTDASYVGNDFKDALFSGVKWDSANSKITLDSASDDGELNSQWTPQYNNIVGYWKLNGTSGSSIAQGDPVNATIGTQGAVSNSDAIGMQYSSGKQRQGIQFDGTNDYVTLGTSADYRLVSSFSASMWIKVPASVSTAQYILSQATGANNTKYFGVSLTSAGKITASLWDIAGTGQGTVTAASGIVPDRWYHIVFVYDGSKTTLYVDGVSLGSVTYAWNSPSVSTSVPLQLGARTGTSSFFKGIIDETAIWKTALTDSEVKMIYERQNARYTGTILSRVMNSGASTSWAGLNYLTTLPYGKEIQGTGSEDGSSYSGLKTLTVGRIGAWALDELAGSASVFDGISNHNGTVTGATLGTTAHFSTGATFNGSSDIINLGDYLNPGSTSYSVSVWFKRNSASIPASAQAIMAKGNDNSANAGWSILLTSTNGAAITRLNGNGTASQKASQSTSSGVLDMNWHHVVMVIDRSNNSVRSYFDGNPMVAGGGGPTSDSIAGFDPITNTDELTIGALRASGVSKNFFNGVVDDAQIWGRALSTSEVTELYQRTQPLDSPFNQRLVGLWHMNSDWNDSSGNGNNGTATGATLISTSRFGSGSGFFSAATDSINAGNTASITDVFANGGAISAWIYPKSTTSLGRIFDKTQTLFFVRSSSGDKLDFYQMFSGGFNQWQVPISLNIWQHVVVVYNSSSPANVPKIYIDGVSQTLSGGSTATGTPVSDVSNTLYIGNNAGNTRNFDGMIDELGVWKRPLSDNEIQQLYRRGTNRIKLQARTCSAADCSDDAAGANWRGSANNNKSYFSEFNNSTASSPQLLFSNFGVSLTNNPYFQYRAILESDDASTAPDLVSVSAGPARYDGSNPTIIPVDGPKFQIYTGFTTTLGASCSGTPKFQLSHDKKTWYYYSAGMWNTTTAGVTQASDSSTINTNIATFGAVAGTGELYAKVFYPSDTSTACEIDQVAVAGADSSSTNSSNPNAFTITSITSTNTTATLNWNAASGATSYKICYGTTQALANACATFVTVTGTSTTISSLLNDTQYFFAIQASNTSGVTVSNTPVYTTPMAVPSVPNTLVATNGIQVINLAWVASTGSGSITYNIKRGTSTTGPYTTIATGVTTTAYSDSSATPGTPYYYVVTATNSGGTSANSNEAASTAMSLVNYVWTFDAATDSSYSFDSSKVQLAGGVCRLTNATPTDASFAGNDFQAAMLSGVKWDSTNNKLTLDSTSDGGELSGAWTPQYHQIIGYWKFNGTIGSNSSQGSVYPAAIGTDGVFQNANASAFPNSGLTAGKQGQAVRFDGVDDLIRMGSPSSLQPTTHLTFSTWAYANAVGAVNFIGGFGDTGTAGYWLGQAGGSGTWCFSLGGSGSNYNQLVGTTPVVLNQWVHVVGTYDGTQQKLYVNGKLDASATVVSGPLAYTGLTGGFMVGNIEGINSSRYWNGSVDEVAVWNATLTATEVKTLYERENARFTGSVLSRVMNSGASTSWAGLNYLTTLPYGKELPSTQMMETATAYSGNSLLSGLVGFWHMDETTSGTAPGSKDFKDVSGNGVHGKADDTTKFAFNQTGALKKAATINGGQISYTAPTGTFNSGIATVSMWLYWDGTNSKMPFGFNLYDLYFEGTGFGFNTGSSDLYGISASGLAGRWVHIVAEFHAGNYTSNKLYIDGVSQTLSQQIGTPGSGVLTDTFKISGWGVDTGYRLNNSQLDEIGVWNRALTQAEVTRLNKHQVDLSTGLTALWNFNEASGTTLTDSVGGFNGTLTGTVTLAQPGKLSKAMKFDGSTGYASTASHIISAAPYTVCTWVKSDVLAPAANSYIIANGGETTGNNGLALLQTPTQNWYFSVGSAAGKGGVATAPASTDWTYLCGSWDGQLTSNGIKLYVNGALAGSATAGASTAGATSPTLKIGRPANVANYMFKGLIDETALWSRVLNATEIQQLYQRGATRIKLQARTCSTVNCSDDPNGTNWRGSGNTSSSYFSESDNKTAGVVNTAAPAFNFSDFSVSLTNNPYFQYRAIFESDSASLSPDLVSVSAGPGRYDASQPAIIPVNGPKFQLLTSFTVQLGAGGCSATPKFQLSTDKTNWYYYNSGWSTAGASADASKANDASTISTNIRTFSATAGIGTLYVRAYLPSDTTTACEIDSIAVQGGHTSPSNSSNPNAFQITSVTGGNGSATVNWSAATGATSYTICYGLTQADADACVSSVTSTGTSTTISGLTNNSTYYFSVNATTSGGRTPASVSTSTTPMLPPSVPTALTAVGGNYFVNLNWAASTGSGTITYSVKRSTTTTGPYTTLVSGLTSNGFADLTALAGTAYYYVVTASNAGGESANSSEATTAALGSFSITSAVASDGTVMLTWGAALGATSYDVKYGTSSGTPTTTLSNKTSGNTLTGFTSGTTYYLVVVAKNASGASTSSMEVTVVPVLAYSITPTAGLLSVSVGFSNTATGATSSKLEYGTTAGSYTTTINSPSNPQSITGLTSGVTYYFRSTAWNAQAGIYVTSEVSAIPYQTFTYNWGFDEGTDSSYNFLVAPANMEMKYGVCRLKNLTPWDTDSTTSGFGAATLSGVKWDNATKAVILDSTSDDGQLNASWNARSGSLVGYWKMNGVEGSTAIDTTSIAGAIGQSGTLHNPNGTGATYIQGKQKQGLYFDGVDDNVTIPDNSWNPGTGDFSLSYWINVSGTISGNFRVVGKRGSCGHDSFFSSMLQTTGVATFELDEDTSGTNYRSFVANTAVNDGKWHYLTFVRAGTQLNIYVDGRLDATTTTPGIANIVNSSVFDLGGLSACSLVSATPFSLDEIGIFSTALSAADVKMIYERQGARYTGTLVSRVMDAGSSVAWTGLSWLTSLPFGKELAATLSGDSLNDYHSLSVANDGLIAHWRMDESTSGTAPGSKDFTDDSGGNHLTQSGSVAFGVEGKIEKSAGLNGNNQYLKIPAFTSNTTTNDFTVSAWVYLNAHNSGGRTYILDTRGDGTAPGDGIGLIIDQVGATSEIHSYIQYSVGAYSEYKVVIANPVGKWTHIVFGRTGSTLFNYVDGVQTADTFTTPSAAPQTSTMHFDHPGRIGTYAAQNTAGGNYWMNGRVDDVQIWNRALASKEITELAASRTNLMTGNIGLWHMNESSAGTAPGSTDFKDDSGNGNHGTAIAPATVGRPGKFGKAANSVNGGWIIMGSSNLFNVTDQLAFAGWYYMDNISTGDNILMNKENVYELNAHGTFQYALQTTSGAWAWVDTGVAVPLKQWYHYAFTYNSNLASNQVKLFLNGALVYQGNYTGTFVATTSDFQLGSRNGGLPANDPGIGYHTMNGAIDEVGLWSRALSATEVAQLYRRGANRLKFQVRSCVSAGCADDPTDANWRGAEGANSYFSELNNLTSGIVSATSPHLLYADSTLGALANGRYFQYRAVFESDDTTYSPELNRVEAGPARFDATVPVVDTLVGSSYLTFSSFKITLGDAGCSSVPHFQFSKDGSTWYWYNGSNWVVALNWYTQANDVTTANTNMSTLAATMGTGTVYVRTQLPSTGTSACEIDQITIGGTKY